MRSSDGVRPDLGDRVTEASARLLLKGGNGFLYANPRGDITHPREGDAPNPVSWACDLQVWASGVPLLASRTLLGMEADGGLGALRLRPYLPLAISRFRLGPLQVGGSRIKIETEGEDSKARIRTLSGPTLQILR